MQTISFSDARNNLKHVLDRVANDRDMKTPANAAHLQRSIAQYQSGQAAPQELADD